VCCVRELQRRTLQLNGRVNPSYKNGQKAPREMFDVIPGHSTHKKKAVETAGVSPLAKRYDGIATLRSRGNCRKARILKPRFSYWTAKSYDVTTETSSKCQQKGRVHGKRRTSWQLYNKPQVQQNRVLHVTSCMTGTYVVLTCMLRPVRLLEWSPSFRTDRPTESNTPERPKGQSA